MDGWRVLLDDDNKHETKHERERECFQLTAEKKKH